MASNTLTKHPVHLGLGATAEVEPLFTGEMEWYMQYAARHQSDGAEGRLVSMSVFSEPWNVWEMHPHGSELVLCVSGALRIHQQKPDGSEVQVDLAAGEYAVNDPGVWHTADVDRETTVVFITAGLGTENRPR